MGVAKVTLNGVTQMDVTQKTVEANKMLYGITALAANGEGITGSIAANSSSSLTASGATVTAPAGYYASNATKTIDSGAVTPSTSNTGLSTYFTSGTSSNKDVTITPQYTNTAGYIAAHSTAQSGTPAYYKIITATPAFDGGDLTGGSTAEGTNITLSSTDNGIKIQTKYTANRAAVLYNGAVSGWVSKADNAQALAAGSLSSTNGNAYYVRSVTVPVDVAFSVTTTADTTYDTSSYLTITNNDYRRVSIDNTGYVTVYSNSKTAGNVDVGAYVDSNATNVTNAIIVQNGMWNTTNVTAANTYYGRVVVPAGSVTAPASISGSSATVSTGTNTLTLRKTISVTPSVTLAGYISNGTAGDSSVSLTASVTTKAAATYNTSSSDQTIASGTYLTGTQTIRAVTTSGISAANIKDGTTITVGDAGSSTRIANVTGTFTDASTVSSGQTAATAAKILSGYSAWVDGSEVKGNISTITLPTTYPTSATSGYTTVATLTRTTVDRYINIPTGYNASNSAYLVKGVANGSATAPASISGSSATVSTGTNTLTLSKTVSVTPTVSAGYVSSGTAGNSSVSLTASVTTKAATTYYPSGSDQTIASGTYTTGTQTFKAVQLTNLSAANIAEGVVVKVGDADDDDRIISITGTHGGAVPPVLATKTVTVNGTYNAADDNADGYSSVVVNVPTGTFSDTVTTLETGGDYHAITGIQVGGTKTITTSGLHDVANYALADVKLGGSTWTRPSDWPDLSQMDVSGGNILYMTSYADEARGFCSFRVDSTGPYTVEVGTISSATFTADSTQTYSSGSYCELYYGTVNGTYKVLRVTGTAITKLTFRSNTALTIGNFYGYSSNQGIIDVVGKLPSGTGLSCSSQYNLVNMEIDGLNLSGSCSSMFDYCYSLTSLDVTGWNTSSVTNMGSMFQNCSSLTSLDESGWDTSSVTSMGGMFQNCYSLTSLDVSEWNISKVTNMSNMFNACYSLTSLNVSEWSTGSMTSMQYMFYCCTSLTSLDVSEWNTSSVTSMQYMFYNCYSLTSLDVSGWSTGSVTNMSSMFSGCASLVSLDVSDWSTGSVTNMSSMFYNCASLSQLDVSDWSTENVTNMSSMFYQCYSLTSLDVSEWSFSGVTTAANARYMFRYCRGLRGSLTLSSTVTQIGSSCFEGCRSLTEWHFKSTTPPALENTNAFSNMDDFGGKKIYVPSASLNTYKTAANWSTYADYMVGE